MLRNASILFFRETSGPPPAERLHLKRAESSSALPSSSSGGVGDTYRVEASRKDEETTPKNRLGSFHAEQYCVRDIAKFLGYEIQYKTTRNYMIRYATVRYNTVHMVRYGTILQVYYARSFHKR